MLMSEQFVSERDCVTINEEVLGFLHFNAKKKKTHRKTQPFMKFSDKWQNLLKI